MAIKADDSLIVALDVHTMADVEQLVQKLGDTVSYYKVGMELFYSVGPDVVRWLSQQGKKVFLDLKLHDIPNTVAGGLCSLMDLGASIVNVHASGGYTMMKPAAERLHAAAAERGIECPKIIAITVLTSIGPGDEEGRSRWRRGTSARGGRHPSGVRAGFPDRHPRRSPGRQ